MDEMFIKKVRAAAVAGWWTVLVFYCILLIQWLAYWVMMSRQPEAMLCIWGRGSTWVEIRTVWLWAMVVYKLCFGVMVFVVIWLTLWARQLAQK